MRQTRQLLALIVIGLVAASCGGGGGTSGSTPSTPVVTSPPAVATSPPSSPAESTLTMVDNAYQPTTVSVASGSALTISNQGQNLHNFTIKGKFSLDFQPGQSQPVPITVPPGTYDIYCKYHKAVGMTGTLTVT